MLVAGVGVCQRGWVEGLREGQADDARIWIAIEAKKVDVGLDGRNVVFCVIRVTVCRGDAWQETAIGAEGETGAVGVFVCVEKDVCAVVLVVT